MKYSMLLWLSFQLLGSMAVAMNNGDFGKVKPGDFCHALVGIRNDDRPKLYFRRGDWLVSVVMPENSYFMHGLIDEFICLSENEYVIIGGPLEQGLFSKYVAFISNGKVQKEVEIACPKISKVILGPDKRIYVLGDYGRWLGHPELSVIIIHDGEVLHPIGWKMAITHSNHFFDLNDQLVILGSYGQQEDKKWLFVSFDRDLRRYPVLQEIHLPKRRWAMAVVGRNGRAYFLGEREGIAVLVSSDSPEWIISTGLKYGPKRNKVLVTEDGLAYIFYRNKRGALGFTTIDEERAAKPKPVDSLSQVDLANIVMASDGAVHILGKNEKGRIAITTIRGSAVSQPISLGKAYISAGTSASFLRLMVGSDGTAYIAINGKKKLVVVPIREGVVLDPIDVVDGKAIQLNDVAIAGATIILFGDLDRTYVIRDGISQPFREERPFKKILFSDLDEALSKARSLIDTFDKHKFLSFLRNIRPRAQSMSANQTIEAFAILRGAYASLTNTVLPQRDYEEVIDDLYDLLNHLLNLRDSPLRPYAAYMLIDMRRPSLLLKHETIGFDVKTITEDKKALSEQALDLIEIIESSEVSRDLKDDIADLKKWLTAALEALSNAKEESI